MKERLRGREGRMRGPKLPLRGVQKEKSRENRGMAIFGFPELTEAIHPQTADILRALRTPKQIHTWICYSETGFRETQAAG